MRLEPGARPGLVQGLPDGFAFSGKDDAHVRLYHQPVTAMNFRFQLAGCPADVTGIGARGFTFY